VAIIGESGGEGLTLQLGVKFNQPVAAEGLAAIYSRSMKDKVLTTEMPWLANGFEANIVSFVVRPGSSRVLQALQKAQPVYGQVSSNVFSYTKPF